MGGRSLVQKTTPTSVAFSAKIENCIIEGSTLWGSSAKRERERKSEWGGRQTDCLHSGRMPQAAAASASSAVVFMKILALFPPFGIVC